jgi:hypothetical protein
MPPSYPRIAIRCKNPSCPDRGRVLGETDGPCLYVGGSYLVGQQAIYCQACDVRVVWVPSVLRLDKACTIGMREIDTPLGVVKVPR